MSDAIEECGGHFSIAEYGDPFGEGEIGCDDQRCFFVELADQMEQQCAAGCREWQIAQLIEDHGVRLDQLFGEIAGLSLLFFPLQLVHQIDGIIEANALSLVNGCDAQGGCQMSFAGARRGSVTMPGVRRSRCGFTIRFILDAARSWWSRYGGGLLARNTWSLFNQMARSL
jgi:hypothetical protein